MGKKLNILVCPSSISHKTMKVGLMLGLVNVYAKAPETAWEAALILSRQILTSGTSLLDQLDQR
jgi:hypothetical protein